jgi:hypothetical protein
MSKLQNMKNTKNVCYRSAKEIYLPLPVLSEGKKSGQLYPIGHQQRFYIMYNNN